MKMHKAITRVSTGTVCNPQSIYFLRVTNVPGQKQENFHDVSHNKWIGVQSMSSLL